MQQVQIKKDRTIMLAKMLIAVVVGALALLSAEAAGNGKETYLIGPVEGAEKTRPKPVWKTTLMSVASTFSVPHGAPENPGSGDIDYFAADYFSYNWATGEVGEEELFKGIGTGRFISSEWYEETVTYLFPDNYTTLSIAGVSRWIPFYLTRSVIGGTGNFTGASGQGYFSIVVHPEMGPIVCGNVTVVTPYEMKSMPAGFDQPLPNGF